MRRPSRRHFLRSSALFAGAVPILGGRLLAAQNHPFRHGVASGDPLHDAVVIWTRVTPPTAGALDVSWVVARDSALRNVVARGQERTGAERDHTVKVDVSGLQPATTYYYGFRAAGAQSPTGRTRTAPVGRTARLRLAVVSCANLPFGFFNAYGRIADREDLDAVLHLGDYIYEYPNGQYGDGSRLGRVPDPDREIVRLDDYRTRHAQYKLDPDLQDAHRQHPFIVIWDDHELANNTWRDGAANHNPEEGEGEWPARRDAAVRAFFEWMPIREPREGRPRIYRRLAFGDLADLVLLDTRLVGRDRPAASREAIREIEDPRRSLIGEAQEAWLAGTLAESARRGARWPILGQQVMFAPQSPAGQPTSNADSWDGYRAARDRVFDAVERARLSNFVVLTGDVHSSWAYDLPRHPYEAYDRSTGRGSVGVEIAGTSITSPSNVGAGPDGDGMIGRIRAARPHLHYVDGRYRGYVIVDISPERLQADFFAVDTIEERAAGQRFVKGFVCETGRRRLVETGTPSG